MKTKKRDGEKLIKTSLDKKTHRKSKNQRKEKNLKVLQKIKNKKLDKALPNQ